MWPRARFANTDRESTVWLQPESYLELTSSKFKFKSKNRKCHDKPALNQLSFLRLIS